jgi:hypothetical protein
VTKTLKIGVFEIYNPYERPDFVDEGFDYLINAFGVYLEDGFYHCPCCHYPTLKTRGSFEVCPVCYWEDDGQDHHDKDRVRGGPNGVLSLTVAIANFKLLGACESRACLNVRPPNDEEIRNRKI